jgi:hypothetical protein
MDFEEAMRLETQDNANNPWKQFVFYGEVVGFVLVWVMGALLVARTSTPEPSLANTRAVDSVADAGLPDLPAKKLEQ